MTCGAPGMCGHRKDCADKHCPGRNMEPRDMLDDGPLLDGIGVLVWLCVAALGWLCVAALGFTAWVMFG